ncbi:nucleoporin 62 like [Anguilla anguilla]|uniref:nucleoporin 62 like n=1 Tax=Anguilla anguilla TaxID=7936 RepID=UPI0015A90E51|nr:nucleoporin 62 like [Anguilla anguilla]
MSFSFGSSNAGFSFGTPKTTAGAVPPTGFGMVSTSTAGGGGGFSFGTPNQSQPPAAAPQATGLFSSPAQSSTGTTAGFSFGTPAQNPANTGGFSFGTNTPKPNLSMAAAAQPAPTGLTLGTVAPSSGAAFSLGGMTTQSAAAPAGGGFSFGASTGIGTPAAPAQTQPAATVAPTGGFSMGGPPATQSLGGFSFGGPKVQVQANPTAAPTVAGGGGFSFGTTTAAAAPVQPSATLSLGGQNPGLTLGSVVPGTTTAPGTTAQAGGFAFGVKPSATPAPAAAAPVSQPAPADASSLFTASTVAASIASAAPTGFTLGAATAAVAPTTSSAPGGAAAFMLKPLGAATTSAATSAAPASGAATVFSLGLKPAAPTVSGSVAPITGPTVSITGTATSTAAAATSAPPTMSYAQLESLINKWSLELEDQERHFLQQATQVNAWDRMLLENGEKITSLHREMEKVKLDQRRLDQELDFILSQQKELEDLLTPLEESVKEQSGTIYMQNADEERERTYKLAENVDAQLKRMSQDLKEIIEHLNTSSGPADTSDPLQQICKILNAHMDSLQWIDQNSVLLQRRVEEVSKLCDNRRKEQEKSFRITFE